MKVKTLTPIHVSSGEMDDRFLYKEDQNQLVRYSIHDLLKNMDVERLLNPNFLNQLSKTNKSKQVFSKVFQNVTTAQLPEQYRLYFDKLIDHESFQNSYVSIQIKTNGKPYIPGSSVKGAIMTAIVYDYFKQNIYSLTKAITYLSKYRKVMTLESLLNYIIDGPQNEHSDFIKQWSSCLLCSDIYFEEMEMHNSIRAKTNTDEEIPIGYVEAIQEGQVVDTKLFELDQNRLLILEEKYRLNKQQQILKYMNRSKILSCITNYSHDMLVEEVSDVIDNYEFYSVDDKVKMLYEKSKNTPLLRIGKATNYWFKSISLLVKKNNITYFKENYERYFAPVKKKSKADTIPSTRVFLYNGEYHLAGYLELDDVEEN